MNKLLNVAVFNKGILIKKENVIFVLEINLRVA